MRKGILFILLSVLISTAFADVLFYDNFERADGDVGNNWQFNTPPHHTNSSIIDGKFNIDLVATGNTFHNFTSQTSGKVYIEYDWKLITNDWTACVYPVNELIYIRYDWQGNIAYDDNSNFTSPTSITQINFDQWYDLKICYDLDNNTFSFWLDGIQYVNNVSANTSSSINSFYFLNLNATDFVQQIDEFIVYNDTAPDTPQNLLAIENVSNITLNWDAVSEPLFVTYKIFRDTTPNPTTEITEVGPDVTTYEDAVRASQNTDYYYRIKAVGLDGQESGYSNEVELIHLQPDIRITGDPVNISVGYGYEETESFTIHNDGNYDLEYCIAGANENFGNGNDGELIVNNGIEYKTDSVKSKVNGTNETGQNTIALNSSSGLAIGDEVLIISMQDSETNLDLNTTGQYETHLITVINVNTLTLDNDLQYTYDQSGDKKHQVIRVPNYTDVTVNGVLTCDSWNGETGGIVFFRSNGTVTINSGGKIDVSGKGYRGGSQNTPANQIGRRGEGILGNWNSQSISANLNGGGGGDRTWYHSGAGGGGGGYGIAGENGTDITGSYPCSGGTGGQSIGLEQLQYLFLGAGGGAGGNDGNDPGYGGGAGTGGGIILVTSSQLIGSGNINSNGIDGEIGYGELGGGGGGSGGSIYLRSFNIFTNINANGGNGNSGGSTGGNGGYGRIRIDGLYTSLVNPIPYNGSNGDIPFYIALSPQNGTIQSSNNADIQVEIDAIILSIGTYIDTLIVLSNDPDESEFSVIVNTTVQPPVINLNPTEFEIKLNTSSNTHIDNFEIHNSGTGKLEYAINEKEANSILSFNPSSGTIEVSRLSQQIEMTTDGTNLTDGVYNTAAVIISNSISPDDSLEISVIVKVDYNPPLTVQNVVFAESESSYDYIRLVWDSNTLSDSVYYYNIYRKREGENDDEYVLKGTSETNEYEDYDFTGLDDCNFYYKVSAVDWVDNEGTKSNECLGYLLRFQSPVIISSEMINNNRDFEIVWNQVTQTMSGSPGTPTCYVIYFNESVTPNEDFSFLSISTDTLFIHQNVGLFQEQDKMFYIVTAYGGSLRSLNFLSNNRENFKYGELERMIAEFSKNKISTNKSKKSRIRN